jgi:hypothetical protein
MCGSERCPVGQNFLDLVETPGCSLFSSPSASGQLHPVTRSSYSLTEELQIRANVFALSFQLLGDKWMLQANGLSLPLCSRATFCSERQLHLRRRAGASSR